MKFRLAIVVCICACLAWSVAYPQSNILGGGVFGDVKVSGGGGGVIAFNGAADLGNCMACVAYSHTYPSGSGSQRLLIANVAGDSTGDYITGIAYNSVAMTLVTKQFVSGERWQYEFYLLNPASGTNTAVVSTTCSSAPATTCDFILVGMADYTGVATSSALDNFTTNVSAGGSTLTTSLTTSVNNDWTILIELGFDSSMPPSAGAGLTRRTFDGTFGTWGIFDSGAAITPAMPYSMTTNRVGSSINIGHTVGAFKP